MVGGPPSGDGASPERCPAAIHAAMSAPGAGRTHQGQNRQPRSSDLPQPEEEQPQPEVQTILQQIPGDPGWEGMSFAVALVTRGDRKAVALVTSRETKDPKAAAIKLADDAHSVGRRMPALEPPPRKPDRGVTFRGRSAGDVQFHAGS